MHPDNQSRHATTTLCQPIGEALILFARMISSILQGSGIGEYWTNGDHRQIFLGIHVPDDYRANSVIDPRVAQYKVLLDEDELTVCAYNSKGQPLSGDKEDLLTLYKLLPSLMVMIAAEFEANEAFRSMLLRFAEKPAADVFVNLHEDLYQAHKKDETELDYKEITAEDIGPGQLEQMQTCSERLEAYKANRQIQAEDAKPRITPFPGEAFTDEQKGMIPHLPSEFVLPEPLVSVCNALSAGDLLSVLFHGPAGTGKTMACKLVAQEIGLPLMETINCTENLDEFVLGKYIPQEDRILFKESYVTRAIREGGAVVFEEINFAKPQHLAFLNSLLDDNGFVRLDNGETVRRHPNFRFFATMNIGYFGTKELNQALYNRFSAIVELAELSDEAITRMLLTRVPECEPMVQKVLGVYHKLKKKIEAEELDNVISPRNLENWVRLAKYEGYREAAEKTIIPIAKSDRALEDTIRGILMLYKWA